MNLHTKEVIRYSMNYMSSGINVEINVDRSSRPSTLLPPIKNFKVLLRRIEFFISSTGFNFRLSINLLDLINNEVRKP